MIPEMNGHVTVLCCSANFLFACKGSLGYIFVKKQYHIAHRILMNFIGFWLKILHESALSQATCTQDISAGHF